MCLWYALVSKICARTVTCRLHVVTHENGVRTHRVFVVGVFSLEVCNRSATAVLSEGEAA